MRKGRASLLAAVLKAPQWIEIQERPVPRPGLGEVLVQPQYVAICGSDQARFWGHEPLSAPGVVIGHECSGRVSALGPGVTGLQVGQLVTLAPLLNCGECAHCQAGKPNLCAKRRVFGRDVDGALQTYLAVPAARVYPLPSTLSAQEGALVEPLAVACHAVRRAATRTGASALVLGAGAIGLLIAQVWIALDRGPVAVTDRDPQRLKVAAGLGIQIRRSIRKASVQVLFEATGSPRAFNHWLPALDAGGQIVLVGKFAEPAPIDWLSLLRKEGEIIASRYFTLEDFALALQLMEEARVNVLPLIGRTVPFASLRDEAGRLVMEEARQVIRLLVQL